MKHWMVIAGVLLTGPPMQAAVSPPLTHEATLHASLDEAWCVFTTAAGWKRLGVAQVEVDLRVGGLIRTHYDPQGTLGDAKTIENTILALAPHRMIAFRATKAPAGFPLPQEVLDRMWSVVEFRPLGAGRTLITMRGHGYGADAPSQRLRAFFEKGNAWTMRHLESQFPPPAEAPALEPIELTTVVAGSADAVFEALTTAAGWKRFFGVEAQIDLAIGGRFEILFDPSQPAGTQGSEGCTVQAWLPSRMLAVTWSAPPKFPALRAKRTLVVFELEPEDGAHTRIRLTHDGWAAIAAAEPALAAEAAQVRPYFVAAWPKVLEALRAAWPEGR